MITRRKLLLSLGAGLIAAPFASAAPLRYSTLRYSTLRIGVLYVGSHADAAGSHRVFTQALAEQGFIEGKNVAFEVRLAGGDFSKLPLLANELVERKVDLIFAPASQAARAAQAATVATPIVFASVNDPVGRCLVANLARPGGNLTGVANSVPGLMGRRMQLLRQVSPQLAQIAVAIAREPGAAAPVAAEINDAQRAASLIGINMLPIEIRSRRSFDEAGDVLTKFGANGLSCLDSAVNCFNRSVLAEFAEKLELPAIFPGCEYVAAGGLMSYGVSADATYRHAAQYVGKILNGAKPGELPVETPAKLDLAVNRNTAKALGLQLPSTLLEKADRVFG